LEQVVHPLTFQVLDLTGQTQRLLALLLLAVVVVVHKMLKLAQMVVRAAAVLITLATQGPAQQGRETTVETVLAHLRMLAVVVAVLAQQELTVEQANLALVELAQVLFLIGQLQLLLGQAGIMLAVAVVVIHLMQGHFVVQVARAVAVLVQ
jgi:hypothetical protein